MLCVEFNAIATFLAAQKRKQPAATSAPCNVPAVKPSLSKATREQALRNVFTAFDLDGSGWIESSELLKLGKARRSLGHKSDEWTEQKNIRLINKMDTNKDGLISCAEFCHHFEQGLPRDQAEFEQAIAQFMAVVKECSVEKRAPGAVDFQAAVDLAKSWANDVDQFSRRVAKEE